MVNNNIYKFSFVETPRKSNYYCKAFHLRARIFINAVVSTFISAHYQCSLYQCSIISTFHQCISCSHCTVRACINISVFESPFNGRLFNFVWFCAFISQFQIIFQALLLFYSIVLFCVSCANLHKTKLEENRTRMQEQPSQGSNPQKEEPSR